MNEPKPSIEYLAGFFDGEGCIAIGGPPGYQLIVTTAQNDIDILRIFHDRFGGGIVPMNQCFQWYVSADVAVGFLKTIKPYLLLKRQQALLAIEYRALNKAFSIAQGRTVSEELLQFRKEFHEAMKKLKRTYSTSSGEYEY